MRAVLYRGGGREASDECVPSEQAMLLIIRRAVYRNFRCVPACRGGPAAECNLPRKLLTELISSVHVYLCCPLLAAGVLLRAASFEAPLLGYEALRHALLVAIVSYNSLPCRWIDRLCVALIATLLVLRLAPLALRLVRRPRGGDARAAAEHSARPPPDL